VRRGVCNDRHFVFCQKFVHKQSRGSKCRHELCGNPMQVQIVFQNAINWPKWHSQHVSNFTDTGFPDFTRRFFTQPTFSTQFASWLLSWAFSAFQRGHTTFKVAKSLKNFHLPYSAEPNKMQQCIKVLLFLILNKAERVSGNTPPITWSLKLHKQLLVSHTWKVVGHAVVGLCRVAYVPYPTTSNNCRSDNLALCKTKGCLRSFRLPMMGGVSPKTRWASLKIRNNKTLIHCCILLGSALLEMYYDAQIHEHEFPSSYCLLSKTY
jgi:hypothetical protein